jgi:uncharacterized LabA/DUF88 family protein
MRTAFMIDGAFFLARYRRLKGKSTPQKAARDLHKMCLAHLKKLGRKPHRLYRILYYDCPPLNKKVHNPFDSAAIDFSKTPTAQWRFDLFSELRKLRKVAVRLGYIDERNAKWTLHEDKLKRLGRGEITWSQLTPSDFKYEARQKGVDMKLGLDIASIAYKGHVDQIVLVSGDSDFVSAAKLARREGIDFILDPMWHHIREDLHEHIDGLHSVFANRTPPAPPPLDVKSE